MYDYYEAVKEDVLNYIKEEVDMNGMDLNELKERLYEDLINEDSITGNTSGSYTFCRSKAQKYVEENKDLVREMCDEFGDHQRIANWSFPKLKIPHQSHADFCSTDTAGGLDNKKRRYAPRGGVAYRLFLWGFPKGATPPFGTRLCEAKCSVLYALPALP